jgi:hypothetical protein
MLVRANLKIFNKIDLFTFTIEAEDIPKFSIGGKLLTLSVEQEDYLKVLKDESEIL